MAWHDQKLIDHVQAILSGNAGNMLLFLEMARSPGPRRDVLVLSFADSLISVTETLMFFFCKQRQH